ncbi:MAG TPA: TIGR02466 family protein [Caulobacteraceae bacterium]|jgi:uncharacterized protein (TIGR02466 family)|nr:TIGR02466 family protein [Caulobacteraceae bacterium]
MDASRVETFDIFATRFWVFDLIALKAHFAPWRERVDEMRRAAPRAGGRSNRRGWNSDATVFADPLFAPLEQQCREACAFVFHQMRAPGSPSIVLEAWVNLHEQGAYNREHIHGGALLSACFYLTVPKGSGALVFNDTRIGATLSPFEGHEINSAHSISVEPSVGRLVVFPNWLSHFVEPHEGPEPRVAICMNARV